MPLATKETIEAQPLALVDGTPYLNLPEDLYIPPHAMEVFLETFEGPLDLLLYLIRRQNLDILNIPIAKITSQYIQYIDMMTDLRLELAAEYLLMAALLAEIKSRMLLPRQPTDEEDEEDDPRAFLIKKLQEYEYIKKASEEIDLLPRYERDLFDPFVDTSTVDIDHPLPDIALKEMLLAFQDVLKRVEQLSHHKITKEPLSVRERMAAILEKLSRSDNLSFSSLFTYEEGKGGVVVSFLAILELSKDDIIEITQPEFFAEIRIRSKITAV
ncbi:MAG: segregation/condensation protein A [Methylococcales bacterium]|nr:segregation/condensation protein A [Methylococcales bacterium]